MQSYADDETKSSGCVVQDFSQRPEWCTGFMYGATTPTSCKVWTESKAATRGLIRVRSEIKDAIDDVGALSNVALGDDVEGATEAEMHYRRWNG